MVSIYCLTRKGEEMKKIVWMILLVAICSFATDFKCLSRNGWGTGTGRYNFEGEYSSYWNEYAPANKYVLFQYNGYGKVYWFLADKCYEETLSICNSSDPLCFDEDNALRYYSVLTNIDNNMATAYKESYERLHGYSKMMAEFDYRRKIFE